MVKHAFLGPDGKLRTIWRAAIYYAVRTFLIFPLPGWPVAFVAESLHLGPGLTAGSIALAELRNFTVALICTGTFALYEGRHVDSYGLAINRVFGWQTFEGVASRVIMTGAVALGRIALASGRQPSL